MRASFEPTAISSFGRLAAIRFRYFASKNRFAEALAALPNTDLCAEQVIVAFHRLGCYTSASQCLGLKVYNEPAIALYCSYAASVDASKGGELLRNAFKDGSIRAKLAKKAALSIAPYNIDAAIEIAELDRNFAPRILAALLLSKGSIKRARGIINSLNTEKSEHSDFLLRACISDTPMEAANSFNEYLKPYRLRPIKLAEPTLHLNVKNITCETSVQTQGPLVTIVVPAFNSANYIEASLQSLLRQSYGNIEVIVVDDASTDSTSLIVANMQRTERRLRLVHLVENSGSYAARNVGLKHAVGEFVTCHDSDDWAHPEKVARQVWPLLKKRHLVFTLSNWIRVTDSGFFRSRAVFPLLRMNPSSPLFRREKVLKDVGFYDNVRTGADSEYIARLKLAYDRNEWAHVKEPLVLGSHRPNSLMTDVSSGHPENGTLHAGRLNYWEKWNKRHIQAIRGGTTLFVPNWADDYAIRTNDFGSAHPNRCEG